MARYVNADKLVEYLRDGVHAGKAAAVVEKYAAGNAVQAMAFGDDFPEGSVIQVYQRNDGTQWMRLMAYTDRIREVCGG